MVVEEEDDQAKEQQHLSHHYTTHSPSTQLINAVSRMWGMLISGVGASSLYIPHSMCVSPPFSL